jgi:hypothetical protein
MQRSELSCRASVVTSDTIVHMDPSAQLEPRREPWRYVVRAGVTLAVGAAVALWLLGSSFLWAWRCDENCSAGDYEKWQWTGQFALAATGALLAIIALALGFTTHTRAYRTLLAMSVGCALVWAAWVPLSGDF